MKIMDKEGSELLCILGERIRKIRTERGISQEKFAFESDFDRTYISMVERGKRNLSIVNLNRIAKTLEVKLCELLKGIG